MSDIEQELLDIQSILSHLSKEYVPPPPESQLRDVQNIEMLISITYCYQNAQNDITEGKALHDMAINDLNQQIEQMGACVQEYVEKNHQLLMKIQELEILEFQYSKLAEQQSCIESKSQENQVLINQVKLNNERLRQNIEKSLETLITLQNKVNNLDAQLVQSRECNQKLQLQTINQSQIVAQQNRIIGTLKSRIRKPGGSYAQQYFNKLQKACTCQQLQNYTQSVDYSNVKEENLELPKMITLESSNVKEENQELPKMIRLELPKITLNQPMSNKRVSIHSPIMSPQIRRMVQQDSIRFIPDDNEQESDSKRLQSYLPSVATLPQFESSTILRNNGIISSQIIPNLYKRSQHYKITESNEEQQTEKEPQINIYRIFFQLLCQSAKLNSNRFIKIANHNVDYLYQKFLDEKIQFNTWNEHISEELSNIE